MVDLYTIHKVKERIDGLKVAIVGDLRQRSIRSFAFGLAHFDGVDLSVVAPPDQRFTQETIEDLKRMGQGYEVFEDIHDVVDHVDVIYQMSVIQPSYEKPTESASGVKIDIPEAYRIDRMLLEGRNPDLMVLHPLPRKTELATDVDNLPQARYIEQAQNAVPVRMALLALLFGRQAMNSPG
jgi:aspartate carbamoyltransferase catalytic subunit